MEKLTPLSHSIIGLSPVYHEYNPLLIHTLKRSLTLLNGVDCLVSLAIPNGSTTTVDEKDETRTQNKIQLLPLSKCEIVGVVRYCHYKSNGSLNLILDDGTSLCDCIGWVDDLPNIRCGVYDDDDFRGNGDFKYQVKVADLVRVRGAIRVLALDPQGKCIVPVSSSTSEESRGVCGSLAAVKKSTRYYEGWKCIREVRIHHIHVFKERDRWDEEAAHWLRCLQFRKRMELDNDSVDPSFICHERNQSLYHTTCDDDGTDDGKNLVMSVQAQTTRTPIQDGLQSLHALPEEYKKQVLSMGAMLDRDEGEDVVHRTKGIGDERFLVKYFGRQCTCDEENEQVKLYKNRLLYCHCVATKEKLDPDWTFRDALLTKILELENDNLDATDETEEPSSGGHDGEEHSRTKYMTLALPWKSLLFGFQSLYHDTNLRVIASNIVSETSDSSIYIRRLYTQTFRHLRKDGVLYLLDERSDTYMLLSRDRVLLPAMGDIIAAEEQMERDLNQSRQNKALGILRANKVIQPPTFPRFLESVPISKRRLVRRLVFSHRTKQRVFEKED